MLSFLAAIGIMSAMMEEGELIRSEIQNPKTVQIGCREFVQGTLEGKEVVFSLSGVGKVSAATTATLMISHFGVDQIIFTGTAGGAKDTQIGDVVIGDQFLQHDVDPRPFFPQFFLLSLQCQTLESDPTLINQMEEAAKRFFKTHPFSPEPTVHIGAIISGDQFKMDTSHFEEMECSSNKVLTHGFKAVEMEGAAVAQSCQELGTPFVIVRSISDIANDESPNDFAAFIQSKAKLYSYGIIKEYLLQ